MESPAWRVLSLSARRVPDRLCIELRHHAGRESTKLCVADTEFVWIMALPIGIASVPRCARHDAVDPRGTPTSAPIVPAFLRPEMAP
jgi:hypothetical protein